MGLILHLPLNSDVRDIGPYGKSASTTGTITYTSGKMGNASTFTGSQWIQVNGLTCGKNLTIACWAKGSAGGTMLWGIQCAASEYMNLFASSGTWCLNTGDSANNPFQNNGTNVADPLDSKWHHTVVVFQGDNNAKMYIDGVYKGMAVAYKNPTMANKVLTIATWPYTNHGYYWNGQIQDFRVYDEALSPKRIAKLAQGLAARWTLDGLNMGNRRIPNEYQRVEYLESTGTQYINTGHPVTNSTDVDITYKMLETESVGSDIWGVTYPSHWDYSYLVRHLNRPDRLCVHRGATTAQNYETINTSDIIRVRTQASKKTYTWNGTAGNHTLIDMISQNYNAFLFASNIGSTYTTVYYGRSKIQLYSCKMYEGGSLVRDFLPCYRKSDGKPGLYDTITNTFFTNADSGEFLLGPSMGVPAEYQQVEYLKSTGTQYINTGIPVSTELTVVDMAYYKSASQTANTIVFGGYDSSIPNYTYIGYNESNGDNVCLLRKSSVINGKHNPGYYRTRMYTVDNTVYYGVNYNVVSMAKPASLGGTKTFFLFADSSNGTPIYQLKGYIYFFRCFANNVVKDFIPCYRKSDMKPGMYDVITNTFYTNAGSGEFMVGPSIGVPEGYTQLDYIQTTGSQYFDTGLTVSNAFSTYETIFEKTTDATGVSLFGCSTDNTKWSPVPHFSSSTTLSLYIGTSANVFYWTTTNNTKYHLRITRNGTTLAGQLEDSIKTASFSGSTQNTVSMSIFTHKMGASNYSQIMPGKLYSFRMNNDHVTVMDLVPAVRNSDGAIGLYDLCGSNFLTRLGSGTVIAGNRKGFTAFISPSAGNEFDVSGNAMNATVSGSLGTSGYSPVQYGGPGPFSTANCIDAGTKAKLPAPITINVWAKSRDWANEKGAMISCTDSGGWNINGTDVANNQSFLMYINGSYKIISYANSNITAGWHMFTMSYDGAVMRAYFDGVQIGSSSISSTLGYNATNHLFIGAEASSTSPGNPTFNGYVSDLRVYATALSADAIADLYACSRK